jgi:hypothetical protein
VPQRAALRPSVAATTQAGRPGFGFGQVAVEFLAERTPPDAAEKIDRIAEVTAKRREGVSPDDEPEPGVPDERLQGCEDPNWVDIDLTEALDGRFHLVSMAPLVSGCVIG